jgi:tRNA uridine 5-carbamoylmethylation protein Kti12
MSKKAKSRRKDQYKVMMDGLAKGREGFINRKVSLMEKMMADESLKNKIVGKSRKDMNKLELAVVETISSRKIDSVEQLDSIKEKLKEEQIKKAKFKYKPKLV